MRRWDGTTYSVALIIAFALTGATLIWTIPALFDSPEPHRIWMAGVLGVIAVPLAIAVLSLRSRGRATDRDVQD